MGKRNIRLYVLVASLILVGVGGVFSLASDGLFSSLMRGDADAIGEALQTTSLVSAIVLAFVLVVVEVVIGFIPGLFLYPVIGVVLGGWLGGVIVLLANVVGAIISYEIGYGVRRAVMDNGKQSRFETYLQDKGPIGLLLLRVNPLTSYDILVHIAGGLKMPYWPTLLANTVGLIPYVFVLTYFGAVIPEEFATFEVLFIAIIAFYFIYTLYAFYRKNHKKKRVR